MLSYVNSWKLPLNSRQNTIYFLLDAKRNSLRVVQQIVTHKIHRSMGLFGYRTQCFNGKCFKNATSLQKKISTTQMILPAAVWPNNR